MFYVSSWIGVLISVVFVGLSYLYYCWYKKVKRFDHLPTLQHRIPFIGHALRYPSDICELFDFETRTFEESNSKFHIVWLSYLPCLYVYDVKILESILKSSALITKGATYKFFEDWLKKGLVTSNGEKWKSRRRLLTPAFHFGILQSSVSIINQHTHALVSHLNNALLKGKREHDFQDLMKPFSLSVICEAAMGVQSDIYSDLKGNTNNNSQVLKYIETIQGIVDLLLRRIFKPWLHSDFIYKYLSSEGRRFHRANNFVNQFVHSVIESRIENLSKVSCEDSSIFADILIDAYKKNEIDIEGIIEEVNTFMFAGYDTVSTAIAWTLYSLGKDQNIQEKLFNEIRSVDLKDITKDSISQLKYLDCVIRESMRLHPPVPAVARYLTDDTVLGDQVIPFGVTVFLNFYLLHRDEDLWENPLEFNPERFSNQDTEKRNPYAYTPFAAGPRNCIGQRFALLEFKTVLCHLVKNFQFKSLHEESYMGVYGAAVLRAKNGIWLEVSERK